MAIENFIPVSHAGGSRLEAALEEHVRSHGMDITIGAETSALRPAGEDGLITIDIEGSGTLRAHSVVLVAGTRYRTMGVPGEEEYWNKGVIFCPRCDGPLFKDRPVAVIGGGSSGIEATIDLTQIASHVTVVGFLGVLKVDAVLANTLRSPPNVDVLTSTRMAEVAGDGSQVIGPGVEDRTSRWVWRLDLEGVFVQIGLLSDTGWLNGAIERSRAGEIVADQCGATSLSGVFVAGGCANTPYKRIAISLGSGATVALSTFSHSIRSRGEADTPATTTLRA